MAGEMMKTASELIKPLITAQQGDAKREAGQIPSGYRAR